MGKKPIVFETFRNLGSYEISSMTQKAPSSFNGNIQVIKYRVTIEEVDEDDNVIRERIIQLWRECDNHHQWKPLQAAAKRYGMTLDLNDVGKGRKK